MYQYEIYNIIVKNTRIFFIGTPIRNPINIQKIAFEKDKSLYRYQFKSPFSQGRSGKKPPSVVRSLIKINIAVFILHNILNLGPLIGIKNFTGFFGFTPLLGLEKGYLWQLITYMFLHGGILHIFFNMFILFMFGTHLERTLGKSRFLFLYFLSGIGAALLQALVQYNSTATMIGASGAVMGIAAGFAYFSPNAILLIFGIFPVKAWKVVFFYGIYELFRSFDQSSSIAHIAHFGGLVTALVFLQLFYKKYRILCFN